MFEDETVDVEFPKCGRQKSTLVHEFEEIAETHFACEGCKVSVKIESSEFRERLLIQQSRLIAARGGFGGRGRPR